MTFSLPSASLDLQVPIMSDQRVCCIAYVLSKQSLEAERCLPFTQTTRRGVENLLHRYKTSDNFTESIKYLVYTPKCAIIVVFHFPWGDCIIRLKGETNWKQW